MKLWLQATVFAILAACGGAVPGPEDALRLWVEEMEAAAESRDRSAMLEQISGNYADARGNSRKDVGDMLLLYFLHQQKVVLLSSIDKIEIHDDSVAEMSVTVGMAGIDDSVLSLGAEAYKFHLELERVDAEWLLIGARWGELGHDLR